MSHAVFLRNADLTLSSELDSHTKATIIPRFNGVGAWSVTIDTAALPSVSFTQGLVFTRNGLTLMSGPIRDIVDTYDGHRNTTTLSGVDDNVWLANRLAQPSLYPYTSAAYDTRTGLAETVIRGYVDYNLGAGAAAATRSLAGLTQDADLGRGTTVTGNARFHNLLTLCQDLALAGGDLGFRIVQVGTGLQFQVYQPADRTATAKFSPELGNLAGYTYDRKAAEGNHGIAGGGGVGTARVFRMLTNNASVTAYGRVEFFRDARDTTDSGTLWQRLGEDMRDKADRVSLSIAPTDTASVSYGTHYNMGDKVSVMAGAVEIQDIVREVQITYTRKDGEQIEPVIGTPGARDPRVPDSFKNRQDAEKRLEQLEVAQ